MNVKKTVLYATLALCVTAGALVTGEAHPKIHFGHGKIHSTTIETTDNLIVNGTTLKDGEYIVRLNEETGALTFLKNGKVVASAQGRLVDLNQKARDTEMDISTTKQGHVLTGLQIEGLKKSVVLDTAANAAGSE